MTTIQATHAGDSAKASALSRWLLLLMATGAGAGAATLYYAQPILGVLSDQFNSGAATGWVATLTQLGYASGLLFLAPLGDRYDRKTIILAKAGLLLAALLVAGFAPSFGLLLAASFAIGLAATLAQDIVPAAAILADDAHRGRAVGTVMTGLLMGILLSRVISGVVAEHFGWRAMFFLAAASIGLLGAALWQGLPRFPATTGMRYAQLMHSLAQLWMRFPELRRAAFAQGLLSLSFSAFWSTLSVMLHGAPFHIGSAVAGAFGLAGAAGALAAPLAGRLADRRGPELVTRLAASLVVGSFAVMLLQPTLPLGGQLWLIGAVAVGFDLGVQASLIAHQTIIYNLDPIARSRLNAVLMVSVFIGMSSGSILGSQALAMWGWMGVTAVAIIAAILALALRLLPKAGQKV